MSALAEILQAVPRVHLQRSALDPATVDMLKGQKDLLPRLREAVAAVLIQRFFTTYLPPVWGWFTLAWMRRREYV